MRLNNKFGIKLFLFLFGCLLLFSILISALIFPDWSQTPTHFFLLIISAIVGLVSFWANIFEIWGFFKEKIQFPSAQQTENIRKEFHVQNIKQSHLVIGNRNMIDKIKS